MLESFWSKILFYVFVLIALFIYVKLSQLEINGIKLIKLHWRILLAIFFPLIIIIFFISASLLVTLVLVIGFIIFLLGILLRFQYGRKFGKRKVFKFK